MYKNRKLVAFLLAFSLLLTPITSVKATEPEKVNSVTEVKEEISAKVVDISKYGNLTLDISPQSLYDMGYELGDIVNISVGNEVLKVPFCTVYGDVDSGSLVMIHTKDADEKDILVVAINMGNFSKTYNSQIGDSIKIGMNEKKGYLEEYKIRQLTRTNDIADYENDSVKFANFRPIDTKGIKNGILYRSSSPINNEINRAKYANDLAKEAGINTVINLADKAEDIEAYAKKDDFASQYYKDLYDKGSVVPLNMSVDLSDADFNSKLAQGLRFLIDHNGPYLVHCNEGKDRAGFVSAVLSSLMGADLDEIIEDYMVTYENYYHVKKGSEQYNKIAKSNIVQSLTTIVCNQEKGTDISARDLAEDTKEYLKRIGLTELEIERLKICLSDQSGTVTEIEKYGHASSDIKITDMLAKGYEYGDMVEVTFDNGFKLTAPFVDGYYVEKGEYLVRAYKGHETIGICINYGKLNEKAGVGVGDRFAIKLVEKAGYLDQYLARNLTRTNERKDYSSDQVFANFRNLKFGDTAEGMLYRSSSPVNNELGRAQYASDLMKEAGVKTVINLADSEEGIQKHFENKDLDTSHYKELFEAGNVKALNLGLAFESPEFKKGIVEGAIFMSEHEGPYLFHCTEGKDRTGFMAALLNGLMGASVDEIVDDYMESYKNFFKVEEDTKQYDIIKKDIYQMLTNLTGSQDFRNVKLSEKIREYLLDGGMTEDQIDKLIANLSNAKIVDVKPAPDKTAEDDQDGSSLSKAEDANANPSNQEKENSKENNNQTSSKTPLTGDKGITIAIVVLVVAIVAYVILSKSKKDEPK